jgi:hypothetical protein
MTRLRRIRIPSFLVLAVLLFPAALHAQNPNGTQDDVALRGAVRKALASGCAYLRGTQRSDGSWQGNGRLGDFTVGVTALAVIAQINCDIPVDSPEVQRGLNYLRGLTIDGVSGSAGIYETSLAVMALCAADQLDQDLPRIQLLAGLIEQSQERRGAGAGLWAYQIRRNGGPGGAGGDASNGQYAVLALRDAVQAGATVSQETWQLVHQRWLRDQLPNGGWHYNQNDRNPRGSMTVAGLSTVGITSRMLQNDGDVDAEGRPDCCAVQVPEPALAAGRQWMAENFSVNTNPGHNDWYFYYLYGLERAGRLSHVRFFGAYDWYRLGARQLVRLQLPGGNWVSPGAADRDPILNTSMALMFLSRGLSRVVINKLDYTSPNGEMRDTGEWNRHPWDVINLVELIDTLPRWPARLTTQTVTLSRLRQESAVEELNQAPILFLSGREAPQLTAEQISWLRGYVDAGGFIFATACCDGRGFDPGMREIVERMFPEGTASLQKLNADHPVYRSEYLLNPDGVDLWGVDFGCRTSIIYCPEDLGCFWQKWMRHDPPGRNPDLSQRILRANRIGVNIVAYATGREPPEKLDERPDMAARSEERIERGLLQLAQIRHSGGWDTAPRAVRNLLQALNSTVGLTASTQVEAIPASLEELTRFPLVCMHGRYRFQLPVQQQESLREYLNRGGVLFADACCGSRPFDRSFRDLIQQLFPEQELSVIPPDHELYSKAIGHEIGQVRRRRLIPGESTASLDLRIESGVPVLEGIEIDGRLAVIYSRYDISCALEHQASLACDGYLEEDAAKLAVNVVLYSMLQDISWSGQLQSVAPQKPVR